MKKLKICELIDTYYPTVDGAINVARNYTKLLNGIEECKLAVPKATKKDNYVDNEEFEVIRCLSAEAPEKYRLGYPSLDSAFVKKIEDEKFDLFHAHSPFAMGRFAIAMGKKHKIPVIATLHTQYHQDFERVVFGNQFLVDIAIKYISYVYKKADSVWTVSQKSCDFLRQYGYHGRIEVIRNGTDYTYPENDAELIERVNKLHNLEGQKNVFIFVGRMAWYKNLRLLCDALKIIKEKGVDFKMLFIGSGFDFDAVKEYVETIGIADKCILTGNVSDRELIQGYYLRSDLMLFPSTFDMATIVKEEASAHKLAGVVVRDSCTAERVIDGDNGFLCEENAQSLADKVIEVTSNPELMKKAGERAYETLYRNWDDVLKDVHAKYQEVIEEYKKKQKRKEQRKLSMKRVQDIKKKKKEVKKENKAKEKQKKN